MRSNLRAFSLALELSLGAVGVGESPPSSSLIEARVCDGGFVNLSSTPEFLPLLTREGETLGGCCHQFLNTTFPSLV